MPVENISVSFPSFNIRKDDFKDKKVYDNFINVVDQIQQMLVQISGVVNNNAGLEVVDTPGLNPIAGQPNFSVYLNTTASLVINTFVKIPFDTKNFDSGSYFDVATNHRFTPLVAGTYLIGVVVYLTATASGSYLDSAIYKNGSEVCRAEVPVRTNVPNLNNALVTSLVQLNGSTDYVEGYARSDSTSPGMLGGSILTFMWGYRIGP